LKEARLYLEQQLRQCEACGRGFAVQYERPHDRPPDWGRDVVAARHVRCPARRCGHRNLVMQPLCATRVVVKAVPTPTPRPWQIRASRTRRALRPAQEGDRPREASAAVQRGLARRLLRWARRFWLGQPLTPARI
jgi:DNA-directed RNA polymerase subunit RPC12/RpoP